MKLYKSPLDMFNISHEKWLRLPESIRSILWEVFKAHVMGRGYSSLFHSYNEAIAEGSKYNKKLNSWEVI